MSSKTILKTELKDVQNQFDPRRLAIQKVGVRGLRCPITLLDRQNEVQHTVASVSMYVDLPHFLKGAHMSRFVEILGENRTEIKLKKIEGILSQMAEKLNSVKSYIELRFPYFIEKEAPISKLKGLMDYDCVFSASLNRSTGAMDSQLEVIVPVKSLCPCSKEISDKGAHNQRALVRIRIRARAFVWIEELVELAENAASSALYSLLKREDEKFVTEQAYENPVFAEDIVRGVAEALRADSRITWFKVESENYESIHNHNAYAAIECPE